MSDATSVPKYLMDCAIADLSAKYERVLNEGLFEIAPNPFESGRKNQEYRWAEIRSNAAKKLVWC